MTDAPKTVFVTKWALSNGIETMQVLSVGENQVSVYEEGSYDTVLVAKGDCHTTREAAVSRANAMREAKLKALEKQLERVRLLRFE